MRWMVYTRDNLRQLKTLKILTETSIALTSEPMLPLAKVLELAYEQTRRIVDADVFYIAFFDKQTNTVSFPLAVDYGTKLLHGIAVSSDEDIKTRKLDYQTRKANNGLTEYVINKAEPLLIESDVARKISRMGIKLIGEPAQCWLGAPMKSRGHVIGVIAVQDYKTQARFDTTHRMAVTILANQVATAIENVRLFHLQEEVTSIFSKIIEESTHLISIINQMQLVREAVEFVCATWKCECAYYKHSDEGGYSLMYSLSSLPSSSFPHTKKTSGAAYAADAENTVSNMTVDCITDNSTTEGIFWMKRQPDSEGSPVPFSHSDRITLPLFAKAFAQLIREHRMKSAYSVSHADTWTTAQDNED